MEKGQGFHVYSPIDLLSHHPVLVMLFVYLDWSSLNLAWQHRRYWVSKEQLSRAFVVLVRLVLHVSLAGLSGHLDKNEDISGWSS